MRFLLARTFGIDKRSLALFRIALSCVLCSDLWNRARDIGPFYSDQGVLPRSAQIEIYSDLPWLLSLHLMSGLVAVQVALAVIAMLSALALLVGYRTWWATFFSWALLCSLHHRNPMTLQGGDILLRVLLFWSLFLPLGSAFSLDKTLTQSIPDAEEKLPIEVPKLEVPKLCFSTATLAILLQVCFVYWFSAILKSGMEWRSEGSALYYALSIDQLVRPWGSVLLAHPTTLRPLTFFTVYLERFGPLLALYPWWKSRLAIIAVFLGFHFVMGACLTLGIFPWISAVGWILFVPGAAWDALGNWSDRWRFKPPEKWLLARSSLLALLRKWPAQQLDFPTAPSRRFTLWKDGLSQGTAVFFLVFVFCWNLRTVDPTSYSEIFPVKWNWIGHLTGTDQMWDMFSPFPLKDDGWWVALARLNNHQEVDLLKPDQPISWNKPDHLSATFPDALWQKYQMNLWAASNSVHRAYYAAYLTRQWNEQHPADAQRIRELQLVYMREDTLPNHRPSPPQKVITWQQKF